MADRSGTFSHPHVKLVWAALVVALTMGGSAVRPAEADEAAAEFRTWCAACHGASARGDGPVARALRTEPPDLTGLSQRNGGTFPAEQVRQFIDGRTMPRAHGTPEMPVWGAWFSIQAAAEGILQDDRTAIEASVRARIDRMVEYLSGIQEQ